MASDPLQGLDTLSAAIGGVSAQTRDLVEAALAEGNQQRAIMILTNAAKASLTDYRATLSRTGQEIEELKTGWSGFWTEVGKKTDEAADSLQKYHDHIVALMGIAAGPIGAWLANIGLTPTPAPAAAPSRNSAALNRAYAAAHNSASDLGYDQLFSMRDSAAEYLKTIKAGYPGLDAAQVAHVNQEYQNLVGALSSLTGVNAKVIAQNPAIISQNTKMITQADIQAQQYQLSDQAIFARGPAEVAQIARTQTYISLIGQKVDATKAATLADMAGKVAFDQAAHALTMQSAATSIAINGNIALAKAGDEYSDAAIRASATTQAMTESLTNGVNVQARSAELYRQSVSQYIAQQASQASASQRSADATSKGIALVQSGALAYDRLNDYTSSSTEMSILNALKTDALKTHDQQLLDVINGLIDAYPKLIKQQQESADAQARLAALNPNASDIRLIQGLQGQPGGQAAIAGTSLRQSYLGTLSDIGQANPFGAAGQLGLNASLQSTQDWSAQQNKIIEDAQKAGIASAQEAADARVSIEQIAADKIRQAYESLTTAQMQLGAQAFGSLADGVGDLVGKQSAAYKALFAVSKGFAIAQATMNMWRAVSEASALPWPANIPAMAEAAAQAGAILSNIASISGFADGVVGVRGPGTGTSDSILARLSSGESVVTASATSKNRNTLAAMNNGASFDGMGGSANVKIEVIHDGSTNISVQRMQDNNIRVIARQEIAGATPGIVTQSAATSAKMVPTLAAQANKNPRRRTIS
jgi:hypothetical protein